MDMHIGKSIQQDKMTNPFKKIGHDKRQIHVY